MKLNQLLANSVSVLPDSVKRADMIQASLSGVEVSDTNARKKSEDIKWIDERDSEGLRRMRRETFHFTSTSSGESTSKGKVGKDDKSGTGIPKDKQYHCMIAFDSLVPLNTERAKKKAEGNKPRYTRDNCWVFCSCYSFYFYFSWYNYQKGCLLLDEPQEKYQPVVPPQDKGIKNPGKLPGMCKHLISAAEILTRTGQIRP